ncbi:MAG: site-specific tyrosine recombinase XerD [Streptococcaceae bacterium]|jgi:site-specific recombinase XerD|nr:site-specific tyrosine recombinase XerD [Streptococcaceae bacterium]
MLSTINQFLEKKKLSENSLASYRYDLNQFARAFDFQLSKLNQQSIDLFQYNLQKLQLKAPTQQRKVSAINQFLLYLFKTHQIDELLKLKTKPIPKKQVSIAEKKDFSAIYQAQLTLPIFLIIFILETGLNIQDVLQIKSSDVNIAYGFIELKLKNKQRIIPMTTELRIKLSSFQAGKVFLFEHHGHAFTRQWGHKKIKEVLKQFDFEALSPAKLREQYILKEIQAGKNIHQLKEQLGLATLVTLEPYFRGNYD